MSQFFWFFSLSHLITRSLCNNNVTIWQALINDIKLYLVVGPARSIFSFPWKRFFFSTDSLKRSRSRISNPQLAEFLYCFPISISPKLFPNIFLLEKLIWYQIPAFSSSNMSAIKVYREYNIICFIYYYLFILL